MKNAANTLALVEADDVDAVPTVLLPLPEKLSDEPSKWFVRFTSYALAGPRRSVDETWRREGDAEGRKGLRAPGSWRRAAERWRWTQRAAAFDANVIQREAEELAARRRVERNRRRDVAARLLNRLDGLLDSYVFEEAPAPITAAIERAAALHREEFGADPGEDDAAAGAPAVVCDMTPRVTFIVNGEVRPQEPVPPEDQIEPETDGV